MRVLNLKKRSIFTVSINFCTVIEDNFPFLLTRDDLVPISFIPTLAAYADQKEWALYNFTPEEEDEVIAELSNENPKVWKSLFLPDTPTLPQTRTRSSASSIDPQATPPPRLEAMSPLTLPLSPPKRVELDLHEIDIDLSLDEEDDSQAPVAQLTHPLTDTSQITPVIHRPQHHQPPVRQGLEPRRSARLASTSPIPFTTFTEEDIPPTEDIKESGIDGDSDSHEKCVVRGVKSAVIRLDVETGKNKFWYETQWEGHGEEANTYQLACDFDRHPATKAMLRAARDSRDASSAAAKTLEQPNQIYAIHRKSRGYMAKHIDNKFTRADLIFETIYDSIADPLPAHCVSSLAKANVLQENLYCKGAARPMIHAGLIPNLPHEQEPLTPPQEASRPPPKQATSRGRDRQVSWGANSARRFTPKSVVRLPPPAATCVKIPIQQHLRLTTPFTPVSCGIGGVVLNSKTVTGSILTITKKRTSSRARPPVKPPPPGLPKPPAKHLPSTTSEMGGGTAKLLPEKGKAKIDLGYTVLSDKEKEICKARVQAKDPYSPPPTNRREMLKDPYKEDYIRAEEDEMNSLWGFSTFEFVRRGGIPKQGKILRTKWVYSDKLERDGKIDKLKARLTAMGCFQREGIDYHETFASVSRTQTLRVLMIFTTQTPPSRACTGM